MGIISATLGDVAVLLLVLAMTLYVAFAFPRDSTGTQAVLVGGDCSSASTLSTWLHLLINILSTILLSTSSYVMQCLTSPTRSELSSAHRKGTYMDIGVPSFHNLLHISRFRASLWLALLLSSLPLHLLANSIVYETLAANSYVLAVVEEAFLTRPLSGLAQGYAYQGTGYNSANEVVPEPSWANETEVESGLNTTRLLKGLVSGMERLENADCMQAYASPLLSNRRNVIAVTSFQAAIPSNTSSNYVDQIYYQSVDYCPDCYSYRHYNDPTLWICAWLAGAGNQAMVRNCDVNAAVHSASDWTIVGHQIEYCLSEPADGQCQLQANLSIMIVVAVCTLLKIAVICAAFWRLRDDIIATIGDAIASFLQNKEPLTSQSCLLSAEDLKDGGWKPGTVLAKLWYTDSMLQKWSSAPSAKQWGWTILCLLGSLIITIALFGTGLYKLGSSDTGLNGDGMTVAISGAALMRMGFGTLNSNFLLSLPDETSPNGVVGHILLVNSPQLILSISYFAYNAIWTRMLLANEWAQFGKKRRTLRVS